jgi:hypothetical protein
MTLAATGETPKALSFAPIRASKVAPFCLSIVSGPTNGIEAGRLATNDVKEIVTAVK